MEDQDYNRRRDHLLGIMKKQNVLADKGVSEEPTRNQAKRGRKSTKPNKSQPSKLRPNKTSMILYPLIKN